LITGFVVGADYLKRVLFIDFLKDCLDLNPVSCRTVVVSKKLYKVDISKHIPPKNIQKRTVLWIRIGFNVDPDPAFYLKAKKDAQISTDHF
jgi:hypothetical protein